MSGRLEMEADWSLISPSGMLCAVQETWDTQLTHQIMTWILGGGLTHRRKRPPAVGPVAVYVRYL